MSLRAMAPVVCMAVLVCSSAASCSRPEKSEVPRKDENRPVDPVQLTREALVIDAHADTPLGILAGRDICTKSERGHVDFPRMKEGGVTAQFFSIFANPRRPGSSFQNAVNLIKTLEQNLDSCPAQAGLARTAADIQKLRSEQRLAALLGVEGGHAMAGDLGNLRKFYDVGVRYMTLTWSNTNEFADSSGDAPRWKGLNELGERVVAEMNRLGMIIDISHVSDETFWEVMKLTTQPVIASHSSCRALCDIPRNMSDDMLRALAKNGGVVCINFYPGFLSPGWQESTASVQGTVSLETLIDHIDHAIKVAGINHVGLGSDFDGIEVLPSGMRDIRDTPKITALLLERGYSPADVKKVLGENLLRVIRDVVGE